MEKSGSNESPQVLRRGVAGGRLEFSCGPLHQIANLREWTSPCKPILALAAQIGHARSVWSSKRTIGRTTREAALSSNRANTSHNEPGSPAIVRRSLKLRYFG